MPQSPSFEAVIFYRSLGVAMQRPLHTFLTDYPQKTGGPAEMPFQMI